MTLIPTLFGQLARREQAAMFANAASAGVAPADMLAPRGRYRPAGTHRPLALTIAVGIPAGLLTAMVLMPMAMPDKGPPVIIKVRHIPLPTPTPPPDPQPTPDTRTQPATVITAPTPPIPRPSPNTARPQPPTPLPQPSDAPAGDQAAPPPAPNPMPKPADPPAPAAEPVIVEARLNQRFASQFQPDYPAREQREGIEGTARVRVTVNAEGRVTAVEDLGATSPGFFAETRRQALAKWRFHPRTRDGVAETGTFTITVRFVVPRD